MNFYLKRYFLTVSSILLFLIVAGCRVRAPYHVPPVIVPGVTYYDRAPERIVHYHYRYFPDTEVYYDSGRNIYFYFSNNVWLSGPVLPPHIHIDINNYVTVKLEGRKPHIHHKKVVKRYPPRFKKEKRGQKEKLDRKKSRLKRKESELKLREREIERKEEKLERKEDKLEKIKKRRMEREEKARERRKVYRDDRKERREEEKKRRKEPRKDHEERRDEEEQDGSNESWEDRKDRRDEDRERRENSRDERKERREKSRKEKRDKNKDQNNRNSSPDKAIWK